jgi:hypothetical protein
MEPSVMTDLELCTVSYNGDGEYWNRTPVPLHGTIQGPIYKWHRMVPGSYEILV